MSNLVIAGLAPLAVAVESGGDLVRTYLYATLVTVSVMSAIQALYVFVLPRTGLVFRGATAQGAAHVVVVVAGSALGAGVASLGVWAVADVPPQDSVGSLFRTSLVVSTVIVGILVTVDRYQQQLLDAQLREERAVHAKLRADLRALQARTDPHFLFNSLNAVASLIEEDPTKAEQVLEQLSSLFRYALTAPSRTVVCLDEELGCINDYLAVQRVRFGERLQSEVIVTDASCRQALVPPFVLQPLVENAVQHGISPKPAGGSVQVTVRRDEDMLVLRVADDGPGLGASPSSQGTGTALADLAQRLALTCGPRATLTHHSDNGFTVTVTLPWVAQMAL